MQATETSSSSSSSPSPRSCAHLVAPIKTRSKSRLFTRRRSSPALTLIYSHRTETRAQTTGGEYRFHVFSAVRPFRISRHAIVVTSYANNMCRFHGVHVIHRARPEQLYYIRNTQNSNYYCKAFVRTVQNAPATEKRDFFYNFLLRSSVY